MITYDASFLGACNKGYAEGAGWLIELYYDDETAFFTFGTHGVKLGNSYNILPCVKSVGAIRATINPHDCSYSVSNCEVRLAEGMVGNDLFSTYSTKTLTRVLNLKLNEFRNRKMRLRRYIENTGYTSISSFPLEGDFVVYDYWFDKESEEYVFQLVQRGELKHKQLQTIVTKANYPLAPDDSVGMPIPIVYGRFVNNNTDYDKELGIFNYAPSVCTDKTGTFTFASHALKQFNTYAGADQVAFYLDGLKTYGLEVTNDAGTTTTQSAANATVVLPTESGTKYLKVKYTYLRPERKGKDHTEATFPTIDNVIDNVLSTYLAVDASTFGAAKFLLRFTGLTDSSQFLKTSVSTEIVVETYITSYSSSGATRSELVINNPDYGGAGNTYMVLNSINATGGFTGDAGDFNVGGTSRRTDNTASGVSVSSTLQWSWEELGRYEFGINFPAACSDSYRINFINLLVKNLIVAGSEPIYRKRYDKVSYRPYKSRQTRYEFSPFIPGYQNAKGIPVYPTGEIESIELIGEDVIPATSGIFAEIDGRKFSAYIDDGGRANTFNSGDLNELSGFVMESILRDELGFSNSDIDESSIDNETESDWYKFGFSLNEAIGSRQLIQELGFNSRTIACQTTDGQWRFFRFPDTPATSTIDIEYSTIKFLRYHWTSPDVLTNDVTVNYAFDYAKGTFLRKATASDSTSQGNTYQGEKRVAKKSLDCPYIRYSTASGATDYGQNLADFYLAQWKDKHMIIEFETRHFPNFQLQELDTITFANVPTASADESNINPLGLGDYASTDAMGTYAGPKTKYFLIIDCIRYTDKCVYTAFQLHNL